MAWSIAERNRKAYALLLVGVLAIGASQLRLEIQSSWTFVLVVALLAVLAWRSEPGALLVNGLSTPRANGIRSSLSSEKSMQVGHRGETECNLLCNAAPATPGGTRFYSNASEPYPFETDLCTGSYLMIGRPTANPDLDRKGSYPYADHLHGRKRLWEMRWQIRLKQPVDQKDLLFGLEQDSYHWPGYVQYKLSLSFVAALKKVAGDIYQSIGEDPKKINGEAERPIVSFPLWTIDQFIVTPEDEEPPSLTDPALPTMGLVKTDDRAGFSKAIEALVLEPGPTFTFCFWSVSRFADSINWCLTGVPLLPNTKLVDVGIHPPVYIVFYKLRKRDRDDHDTRHLDSNKDYLYRLAVWSSKHPAPARRIQELLKRKQEVGSPTEAEQLGWPYVGFCCGSR